MLADHPIFVVFLVAVLAPLIAQTRLGSRMPVVVFEVVLGIVIGPQVLKLVADHGFLAFMREVGMVAVMFMAGMEIDFARIRGRPLALGAAGWLASIVLSVAALALLHPLLGLALPPTLVIALVTTSLGTLLPILRDGGLLASPLGAMLLAAGTIGEVGPIVAASLVLSSRFSTWQEFALLTLFLGLVALAIGLGTGLRPPKLIALLARTMHSSTQLPVRMALLLLASLIFLSQRFGFEAAIGAFAAGMIVGVATRGPDGEDFRRKIDAVCFGWFAPSSLSAPVLPSTSPRSAAIRRPCCWCRCSWPCFCWPGDCPRGCTGATCRVTNWPRWRCRRRWRRWASSSSSPAWA